MKNYFRILQDPIAKKDIAESRRLAFRLSGFPAFRLSGFPAFRLSGFPAFRLSGRSKSTDVTLFTHYPFKIIEFLDGIIPGRERKRLVQGEAIHYHGVNISYAASEPSGHEQTAAAVSLPGLNMSVFIKFRHSSGVE